MFECAKQKPCTQQEEFLAFNNFGVVIAKIWPIRLLPVPLHEL